MPNSVIFAGDQPSATIADWLRRGKLIRIAPGVYTSAAEDPAVVVSREWPSIVGHLMPLPPGPSLSSRVRSLAIKNSSILGGILFSGGWFRYLPISEIVRSITFSAPEWVRPQLSPSFCRSLRLTSWILRLPFMNIPNSSDMFLGPSLVGILR